MDILSRGVLATAKADGRPQRSNIMFTAADDGLVRISVTASRAKTANMARDPWVSLHVTARNLWSYVVIEADVTLPVGSPAPEYEKDPAFRLGPSRC